MSNRFIAACVCANLAVLRMAVPLLADDGLRPADPSVRLVPVAPGWARTSVNATIFRQSSITTHGDTQYVGFYDDEQRMVLARRKLGSAAWEIRVTPYRGNARDQHNVICLGVDGAGYLHVSWDHHAHPLRYARSARPGSLELTEKLPMTGRNESRVTYPEFFNLPDGGLLFLYRDGSSGNGNTMLNRYDVAAGRWNIVQHTLIDGEGERNAYTNQIAIDRAGVWHLTWDWRETGNVATNHDECYARSADGGKTWTRSDGTTYQLPINQDTAEYVCRIPQNHDLINNTTTAVDPSGRPMLASYWRTGDDPAPQYRLAWHDGRQWQIAPITRRQTPGRVQGSGGTQRIALSRPKLAVDRGGRIFMFFRDVERGSGVSVAVCDDPGRREWRFLDLTEESVDHWEPCYDDALWKRDGVIHLFVQRVGRPNADRLENIPPQMVYVLEWNPRADTPLTTRPAE